MNKFNVRNDGESGQAHVPLNDDEQSMMENVFHKHNFNIFASDRISLHRSLPDYRFHECQTAFEVWMDEFKDFYYATNPSMI